MKRRRYSSASKNRAILQVEELAPRVVPATMTVNTQVDVNNRDNVLSLREAILLANGTLAFGALLQGEQNQVNGMPAANQADSINFNLGAGNTVISLETALPAITDQTTINGFSQQGASANSAAFGQPRNAVYRIEIDGTNIIFGPTTSPSILRAAWNFGGKTRW